jgi:Right handed beta helix region
MTRLRRSGTRSHRITITSYPAGAATLVGYVALEASYTTVSHLRIDGSNTLLASPRATSACRHHVSQPLSIVGHDDILEYDDYYQSVAKLRGTGIGIGFWGHPYNTIIRFSKIHDVGQCQGFDHLIYLSHGNNVQIYGNWLWNDRHGRGVQLYPAPTNARIFDNVIDHVGEGFVIGNEPGDIVAGNQIFNNVITHSTGLPWEHIPGEAIHDLYGGARGTGNTFHNNMLYANPGGMGHLKAVRAYKNVRANPRFADPARHDYQLLPNSPVASLNLWNGILSLPVRVGVG